ncbi:FUSC family protein [Gordonia humi]
MAVQVAIATTLATLVGELISASRWYWAVLTAFLVFVGTTTRGAILTRAYRRVLGTALGVVVGFGIAWFADGLDYTLAISCVICVFFIVYLGPLNYAFMAFFVTVLIASMYGLLGVLNRQVLEWRIEETAAGAAIGVVAAFVIFSTSSRPALESKLRGYFDSLDTLLARSGRAMTGAGRADDVVAAANALGIAHDDLRSFVALMEMSLADRDNRRLRRKATTLIRNAGTQAERLAEVAVRLNRSGDVFTGADAATIDACVAALRTQTAAACETLVAADTSDTEADTTALDGVNGIDVDGMSLRFGAVLAMSEMSASLQQLGRIRESAWPIADGEAHRRPLRRRRR